MLQHYLLNLQKSAASLPTSSSNPFYPTESQQALTGRPRRHCREILTTILLFLHCAAKTVLISTVYSIKPIGQHLCIRHHVTLLYPPLSINHGLTEYLKHLQIWTVVKSKALSLITGPTSGQSSKTPVMSFGRYKKQKENQTNQLASLA